MINIKYFVLIGILVWNVGILVWNIFTPMSLLLLGIMCVMPTILFFGIFIELNNANQIQSFQGNKPKDGVVE
jgi:hypothetical protein